MLETGDIVFESVFFGNHEQEAHIAICMGKMQRHDGTYAYLGIPMLCFKAELG
jgi:hypothetical protein